MEEEMTLKEAIAMMKHFADESSKAKIEWTDINGYKFVFSCEHLKQ